MNLPSCGSRSKTQAKQVLGVSCISLSTARKLAGQANIIAGVVVVQTGIFIVDLDGAADCIVEIFSACSFVVFEVVIMVDCLDCPVFFVIFYYIINKNFIVK